MPSPPIQRSNISEKQQSLSIILSDQSSRSSTSAKGNTWSKKAANLIPRKKYSELTEASLEEFNRRNAILEEKRYSTSSPYNNGLTHSTPDFNEEKVPVIEIHETASVTSSTRSSFVVKMQQMGTFSFILSVIELDENEVKRKLFTWADKYRPCALTDFICNRDIAFELQATAQSEDCNHFILQGPPGVGKRTMIWALLREAFGALETIQEETY